MGSQWAPCAVRALPAAATHTNAAATQAIVSNNVQHRGSGGGHQMPMVWLLHYLVVCTHPLNHLVQGSDQVGAGHRGTGCHINNPGQLVLGRGCRPWCGAAQEGVGVQAATTLVGSAANSHPGPAWNLGLHAWGMNHMG